MGGTGYQPVIGGNLPPISQRTRRLPHLLCVTHAEAGGLVARQHGQVARATLLKKEPPGSSGWNGLPARGGGPAAKRQLDSIVLFFLARRVHRLTQPFSVLSVTRRVGGRLPPTTGW
jgi:hypothetical protein